MQGLRSNRVDELAKGSTWESTLIVAYCNLLIRASFVDEIKYERKYSC